MALLMLLLGMLGAGLGLGVALILDRLNARKVRTYTVRGEYIARKAPAGATPEFGQNGNAAASTADDQSPAGADGSASAAEGEQRPQGDVEQ